MITAIIIWILLVLVAGALGFWPGGRRTPEGRKRREREARLAGVEEAARRKVTGYWGQS